ncbi:hypothetical protein CIPAW_04G117600 [Carya illinoinensis]|uniref:Uncharacterized protein n=1 Tax=Carya illinoinensis TaxID=32201 RepID=A0A8T1QV43_CARIL|nr:hypothetical protein CIPAW_04G117600 [Carya illinoinensis]
MGAGWGWVGLCVCAQESLKSKAELGLDTFSAPNIWTEFSNPHYSVVSSSDFS